MSGGVVRTPEQERSAAYWQGYLDGWAALQRMRTAGTMGLFLVTVALAVLLLWVVS